MNIIKMKSLGIFYGTMRTATGKFLITRAYTRNGVIENLMRLANLITIKN